MKDSQNITIALLLVSASVLAGLFIASYQTETAYAESPSKAGDYLLINGNISTSKDLVYVIDVVQGRLIAYVGDINTNSIKQVDAIDLQKEFDKGSDR